MSNSPQQSNPFGNVSLLISFACLPGSHYAKATVVPGLILGLTGINPFFAKLNLAGGGG